MNIGVTESGPTCGLINTIMRTFYLNGLPYHAPEKVGYGARLYIIDRIKALYIKENPGGATDSSTLEYWMNEHSFDYGVQLAVLQNLLKPQDHDVTVEEGFMQADAEEVAEVLGFFAETATNKIKEPANTSPTGKENSRRRTTK